MDKATVSSWAEFLGIEEKHVSLYAYEVFLFLKKGAFKPLPTEKGRPSVEDVQTDFFLWLRDYYQQNGVHTSNKRYRVVDYFRSRNGSRTLLKHGKGSACAPFELTLRMQGKEHHSRVSRDTEELIAKVAGRLHRHGRLIALGYWVQGLTLREVGDSIGMSECRVCQIVQRIAPVLREKLA